VEDDDPIPILPGREDYLHKLGCCFLSIALAGIPSGPVNGELPGKAQGESKDVDRLVSSDTGEVASPEKGTGPAQSILVHHLSEEVNGWSVAESINFRFYHHQSPVAVEKVARVAEQTRTALLRKWFDDAGAEWTRPCEVYLHPSGHDYWRWTGVDPDSPGHSRIIEEGGRVLSRRIHLRSDAPNLLTAVLPHEVTHTVMAGRFGTHFIPQWANEGMAVLSEPQEQVGRYLRDLPRYRRDGRLLSATRLVNLMDYPEPRDMGAFYAESVSLVGFLTKERGPRAFTRFLCDGLNGGFEAALKRHYGWSLAELEHRWQRDTAWSQADIGHMAEGN
jgi:hypothetical protein